MWLLCYMFVFAPPYLEVIQQQEISTLLTSQMYFLKVIFPLLLRDSKLPVNNHIKEWINTKELWVQNGDLPPLFPGFSQ